MSNAACLLRYLKINFFYQTFEIPHASPLAYGSEYPDRISHYNTGQQGNTICLEHFRAQRRRSTQHCLKYDNLSITR